MVPYPKDSRQTAAAVSFGLLTYLMSEFMSSPESPTVTISQGKLKGIVSRSRAGWEYFEYLGIPYAKPPTDSLRFEPPQFPENWTNIRMANKYSPECIQFELMVTARTVGSEDCLYLNVFTPNVETPKYTNQPLPVMIYFHGGYFMAGSSNMYRAKYFMDEDIVLVTVNYRLAALGFLNTGDSVVRGNMGLKDQNMALRWVQRNIRKFGGDPNKVTIFGESADNNGAIYYLHNKQYVHLLQEFSFAHTLDLTSSKCPLPYFVSSVQSGSSLNAKIWALTSNPAIQSRRLGALFRCPLKTSAEMIACLKKVDARKLVQVHQAAMSAIRQPHDNYLPSIESVRAPDSFLIDYPINLVAKGSFNKVPWMSGLNSAEGLLNFARLLSNRTLVDRLDSEWMQWIPVMLGYDASLQNVTKKIKSFYFGDTVKINPWNLIENFTNLFSDRMFFHGTHKAAVYHSYFAPVYLYYNTYKGDVSLFNLMKAVSPTSRLAAELQIAFDYIKDFVYNITYGSLFENQGPCHADELPLLFNMHMLADIKKSSRDYSMSRAMVKSWTDFAKNEKVLKFNNIVWPPIQENNRLQYMKLDVRPRIIPEPFSHRLLFWDSLGV